MTDHPPLDDRTTIDRLAFQEGPEWAQAVLDMIAAQPRGGLDVTGRVWHLRVEADTAHLGRVGGPPEGSIALDQLVECLDHVVAWAEDSLAVSDEEILAKLIRHEGPWVATDLSHRIARLATGVRFLEYNVFHAFIDADVAMIGLEHDFDPETGSMTLARFVDAVREHAERASLHPADEVAQRLVRDEGAAAGREVLHELDRRPVGCWRSEHPRWTLSVDTRHDLVSYRVAGERRTGCVSVTQLTHDLRRCLRWRSRWRLLVPPRRRSG